MEVERAFGKRLEDVFTEFNPEPLASGSIAQVHLATFETERVVVKVRHPNVAEEMSLDFRLMKMLAEFINLVPGLKWLNLQQSVEAFSHTMNGQTFLDIEGNHLGLFIKNFEHWPDVCFPRPIISSEVGPVSLLHLKPMALVINPSLLGRARRNF